MSDAGDLVDLDCAVRADWEGLRDRLTAYVDDMADGAVLTVRAMAGREPADGCAPWMQLLRRGELVFVTGPSNEHLAPAYHLDRDAEQWMLDRGLDDVFAHLAAPDDLELGDLFADVAGCAQEGMPRRLAGQVVEALQQVYGVLHPAMLTFHEERDDTRALLRQGLAQLHGGPVEPDTGGVSALTLAGRPYRVSADSTAPVIRIDGPVVVDVVDVRAARAWLPRFNLQAPLGELYLDGDQVRVRATLLATPFVPEHLDSGLALVTQFVEMVEPKLVDRAGGRSPRGG